MKTGEGKTLTAVLPAYLNALPGKGVHIVTANDYLAKRDAEKMAGIFRALGMKTGYIVSGTTRNNREAAYNCDVTYITNNELGFDYLRDNMAKDSSEKVQRGFAFAIIDEVDSILIDEARTPLIISEKENRNLGLYKACDDLAKKMQRGPDEKEKTKLDYIFGDIAEEKGDFIINPKTKAVYLTGAGIRKAESYFHVKNLANADNADLFHGIITALRANHVFSNGKDYVVINNEVLIVDEFTGRAMKGRRYSDGLHQAIEAKENVEIRQESVTLATITFQNLFNKYSRKSGMTGTAKSEEKEFRDVYGLDVVAIPTNRPAARTDHEDVVFMTKEEKFAAVIKEVKRRHMKGQPVLIGTASVSTSEYLSEMLSAEGLRHEVLNAVNHEREAHIIASAGRLRAITIATNMAGRGTDIKVDPRAGYLGGLAVIGTERHESRRIDDQLRGRTGRQGEPGETVFYVSLEDEMLKHLAQDRIVLAARLMETGEDGRIITGHAAYIFDKAQKSIEENNAAVRRSLFKYDQVLNAQRDFIYAERDRILKEKDVRKAVTGMIAGYVKEVIAANSKEFKDAPGAFVEKAFHIVPSNPWEKNRNDSDKVVGMVQCRYLMNSEASQDPEKPLVTEKRVLLTIIDTCWQRHLNGTDYLRQGAPMQSYAQRDPVLEYSLSSNEAFKRMLKNIRLNTAKNLYEMSFGYK
jgi:preprotein translocase subunit SecA